MTSPNPTPAPPFNPIAWVVARAKLSDEASAVIGDAASDDAANGDALLNTLLEAGHVVDAVKLIAAALPPREGVWWAWTAAKHAASIVSSSGAKAPNAPVIASALDATERWIAAPDEANRRAVWLAAQEAGMDTPAGSAAGSAFFTGGSIAPPEITPIPPPPGIHATMAFGAVVGASATDPEHFDALARAYVMQGFEVVRQLGGWEQSIEHARAHHDAMAHQHLAVTQPAAPPPPAS